MSSTTSAMLSLQDSSYTRENPTVRGVKRIKDSGSVIVLFDGGDVPSCIIVHRATVRCYLYKKEIEACSRCTRVGPRADVGPTPLINVCHNCGPRTRSMGTRAKVKNLRQRPLYRM
ncbi:hypothetical protein MRX96_028027 [Rhipicephalus microplus]